MLFAVAVFLLTFVSYKAQMVNRIVGGHFTEITTFPHSVFLNVQCGKEKYWICSGSLLNQQLVLTAAHCFDTYGGKCRISAMAGHENIEKALVLRHVAQFIIHNEYKQSISINDISLGYLSKVMPLGNTIKRVFITREFPDNLNEGYVSYVTGWGVENESTNEASMKLKAVEQFLMSEDVCKKIGNLREGMMCAGNTIKDRPSKGDSGSALVTKEGHQIGLVSFRATKTPEIIIYINVSYYYDWITRNAFKLTCSNTWLILSNSDL